MEVSILIPVYNAKKFIDVAVKSVLCQTFTDYEIIIIDNFSTDGTYEILLENYLDNPKIQIFRNEKNIGMVANWNACLLKSNGKYIKMLCADDYLEPNCLATCIDVFKKNCNVNLVYSNRTKYNVTKKNFEYHPYKFGLIGAAEIINDIIKGKRVNPLGELTGIMFKKEALVNGLFNRELYWIADIDFWLRIIGKDFAYGLEETVAVVQLHDAQETHFFNSVKKREYQEIAFDLYNITTRNLLLKSKVYNFRSLIKKYGLVKIYNYFINSNLD